VFEADAGRGDVRNLRRRLTFMCLELSADLQRGARVSERRELIEDLAVMQFAIAEAKGWVS
jgi:hypothetical protein